MKIRKLLVFFFFAVVSYMGGLTLLSRKPLTHEQMLVASQYQFLRNVINSGVVEYSNPARCSVNSKSKNVTIDGHLINSVYVCELQVDNSLWSSFSYFSAYDWEAGIWEDSDVTASSDD